MTGTEYKKGIESIDQVCANKKKEWGIQFAKENNPVKVGDFVTDMTGTITVKVDQIFYEISLCMTPKCIYHGIRYRKNRPVICNSTCEPVRGHVSQSV